MSRKTKGILLAIIGLLVVVAGATVALILAGAPGGMRPSYAATDGDPLLTSAARSAVDIIAAVDRYRRDHAAFPSDAAALAPYLPASSSRDWKYHGTASGYTLWRKLGWDPSLRYEVEGERGQWIFDPGDGRPEKVIQLHP